VLFFEHQRHLLAVKAQKHVFIYLYIIYIYIYIYIKVTSKHELIRLLRCVQIATPSVPYFRSFTITDPMRTNWPLHFYIYRCNFHNTDVYDIFKLSFGLNMSVILADTDLGLSI
jgi:hypothetical protein